VNPFRPRTFGAKLIVLVTLTSGAVAAIICVVLVSMNYARMKGMAIENVQSLANTIGVHSAAALVFDDPEVGHETLTALRAVPQVASATIYDAEDEPFATFYRGTGPSPNFPLSESGSQVINGWLVHAVPIVQDDRRVGTLQLVYDMAELAERLRQNVLVSLAAALLAVCVALLIASRLQRIVTRPVGELVATARLVSERRDFSIRARKVSHDELGTFPDEFNVMLETLQHHEVRLQAAHQRFRTAVEAAPNAMIMVDAEGCILLVNRQTEQMFGYDREALVGQSIEVLVPERHRGAHPRYRMIFYQSPSTRPMGAQRELFARRRDGTEFPVEIGLSPIRTDEGMRVLSSIVDITERKHAELERTNLLEREREAREEAERANRIKDEFLATLSHELRTPMTAILGWAQILRAGGKDADETERGLEVIERNARTQSQIIEDLLDMSRIISGKVRLDVQQVDLQEVIEAAVSTVRPAADARGIRLQTVLDSRIGPVRGDANRLQQVMWNLISNAIKFTPRGGRVQVALERINSHVEISVSDTGQGISPEFLPFVFERFRQADASSTRRHGGLGLGLAIVKQLIELHGGSVHAKSPGESQGSTFIVILPLSVVQTPRTDEEVHPRVPRGTAASDELSLRGVKVLVVDDEPDARDLVARLLESRGAQVLRAASAAEAMDVLVQFAPDVIVSDIGMPAMDGYEFMRQLRSRSSAEGSSIPAIALTAFARSEDRTRSLLAGYQLHVAKPVEPAELVASVATLAGVAKPGTDREQQDPAEV
jgi:PAS domain S-box-containing protein